MTLVVVEPVPMPGMKRIEIWAWICERCDHWWTPRIAGIAPKVCPKCKSPYWDRPRREKKSA